MRFREPLLKYLQREKPKICWRCGYDISEHATNLDEKLPKLECPVCGLIIAVSSRYNRAVEWAFMAILTAFVLGFIIGGIIG